MTHIANSDSSSSDSKVIHVQGDIVQKLHNYSDIKGNALKKLSSRVQIFSFDIFRDRIFESGTPLSF